MVRQSSKKANQQSQQNQDIVFLLSCIRSRQNALIFFLEIFAMADSQRLSPEHYAVYKQEFLQKQKINTQQIRVLLEKSNSAAMPQNQLKSFWIKLKSILRVSLERARTLGMLTQSLQQSYDHIIKLVDGHYSIASPFKQYIQIQQLVKRRTIEALMATKTLLNQHPSQDFGKIRSETFLKGNLKSPQNLSFSPARNPELPVSSMQQVAAIKESTRMKRKDKTKGKSLDHKKIQYSLCRYETILADVMNVRLDYHLDKKKPQNENFIMLYDNLFSRNIANHKVISKYVHSSAKLANKIMQIKRSQSQRKNMSHSRIAKRVPQQEVINLQVSKANNSKRKLTRPNTSKQAKKTIQLKNSSSKKQRIYDLIKVM